MPTKNRIKLGFTFEYFIPGILLIIIGGICFFANTIIATSMLFFGILLLLLRTGIEIDENRKRVRKFYDLFSIHFGTWINTTLFPIVELRPTNESQTMQGRSGQTTFKTKTYDIIFTNKLGAVRELNDFQSYNKALQALNLFSETLLLESKNEVEEIRHAAMKRRKDKNYRK